MGTALLESGARTRGEAESHFNTCEEFDETVLLQDLIEQRLKSDSVARKSLATDAAASRQPDRQGV
jgi:hypothetical protein